MRETIAIPPKNRNLMRQIDRSHAVNRNIVRLISVLAAVYRNLIRMLRTANLTHLPPLRSLARFEVSARLRQS